MSEGDAAAGRHRSMTCGRGTAPAMARALVRARLLRPATVVVLLVLGIVAALPLASSGYLVGAVVASVLSAAFLAAVLVGATHRRALRATRTMYPAGASVSVDLEDDALTLRHAVAESRLLYSSVTGPLLVSGHVLLPLRLVRARISLPPGLLTSTDVEWLRERIARAAEQEAAAPASQVVGDEVTRRATGPDDVVGEVVVTAEMIERARREVLRYRLVRGRVGIVVLLLSFSVGVSVHALAGWQVAVAVALLFGGALLLVMVVQTTRTLQRTAGIGRRIRTRFDDRQLHLDVDDAPGSLAYSAIRSCVVHGGVVVLATTTGLLQALPQELFPEEGLQRLRAAQG